MVHLFTVASAICMVVSWSFPSPAARRAIGDQHVGAASWRPGTIYTINNGWCPSVRASNGGLPGGAFGFRYMFVVRPFQLIRSFWPSRSDTLQLIQTLTFGRTKLAALFL